MLEHLIELSVGESLHVGEYLVTLLNVTGDQLAIEIFAGGEDDVAEISQHDECSESL